jgi:trigger factor
MPLPLIAEKKMTSEIKEQAGCRKTFHIAIERERFDQDMTATLRKIKRDIQIPGFRKGRAPEAMILRRFHSTIQEETLRDMIPAVIKEVLDERGVHPVGDPAVSDLKFEETGPVEFDVAVEEIQPIDIAGFEGLEVTRENLDVTDGDVAESIERTRRISAVQHDVEREIRQGDIVVANLQKLDQSGVPIIGERMEGQVIHLDGSSTPSPDFDAQIVGMSKGDVRKIRFTYDQSINNPNLVGKTEFYEVEILRVVENVIPDLTDELAKNAGGFENIEAMRAGTREHLTERNTYLTERKLRFSLIDEFIRLYPFEVPGSMVDKILESELESLRNSHPGEQIDEQAVRNRMRPDAVRSVQTYLIIDAVKKAKEFDVTRDEVNARIEQIAQSQNMNPKELRRTYIKEGRLDGIQDDLVQEKVFDWMKSVVRISDVTASREVPESRIITP